MPPFDDPNQSKIPSQRPEARQPSGEAPRADRDQSPINRPSHGRVGGPIFEDPGHDRRAKGGRSRWWCGRRIGRAARAILGVFQWVRVFPGSRRARVEQGGVHEATCGGCVHPDSALLSEPADFRRRQPVSDLLRGPAGYHPPFGASGHRLRAGSGRCLLGGRRRTDLRVGRVGDGTRPVRRRFSRVAPCGRGLFGRRRVHCRPLL